MNAKELCSAIDKHFNLLDPAVALGERVESGLMEITHITIDTAFGVGQAFYLDYYNDVEPRDPHRYVWVPADHLEFAHLLQFLIAKGISVSIDD